MAHPDLPGQFVLELSRVDDGAGEWRACIRVERTIHLGYFEDEVQAALAYDAAARTRFGVMANCNFDLQE